MMEDNFSLSAAIERAKREKDSAEQAANNALYQANQEAATRRAADEQAWQTSTDLNTRLKMYGLIVVDALHTEEVKPDAKVGGFVLGALSTPIGWLMRQEEASDRVVTDRIVPDTRYIKNIILSHNGAILETTMIPFKKEFLSGMSDKKKHQILRRSKSPKRYGPNRLGVGDFQNQMTMLGHFIRDKKLHVPLD